MQDIEIKDIARANITAKYCICTHIATKPFTENTAP